MSNVLKSKYLLGVMLIAVMFVGVAMLATPASAQQAVVSASDIQYAATVQQGSSGQAALIWQKFLNGYSSANLVADSVFGPLSAAAAKVWQASRNLSVDGVLGPMSRASAVAQINSGVTNPVGGSYPAGCSSNSGYSVTTGLSCAATTYPAGCTSTSGYSTTTGVKCDSGSTLPAGCSSTSGYSPTTGVKCSGGSNSTGPLTGGAGTLDFTATTSGTEDKVKEGATEKVLAFKAEADGSDIEVTNLKVIMKNMAFATTSEKLTDYVDSVSVWMGDEEVGSADAADFSKDSGSPDTYTKTIALSNAVVRDGVKATFYVALTAQGNIDTPDFAADWNVEADTIRYTDSTGIVLSEALGDNVTLTNGFEDASTDDDISIKSSSSNPVASTLQVEANKNSDEYLVGAFKLDVDDQSADVSITSLSATLTINDSANTLASDDAADIIDGVMIMIDGTEYTADQNSETVTDGDGTGVYTVDLDTGDLTINSGDSAEVKVYVTFNDQSGNYGVGTTVYASVVGATAIDAETDADDVAVSGSFTGKTHTLSVNAPTFTIVGSPTFALYQAIDGVLPGEEDVFLAKFTFDVTAADDDVYLSKGLEGDADYAAAADTVQFTQTNGGALNSAVLDANDSTLDDGLTSSFLVTAGSTERFTLSFYVRGADDSAKIAIDSFAYNLLPATDDTSVTYVYGSVVNSGLSAFTTNSTYLAK